MVPFLLAQILMQASFYSQIGAKNVSLDFDDWWKEFSNHQVFRAHVDLTNNQLSDLICNPENDKYDIVQKNVKTNNTHLPNPIFMNLTNGEMANSTMIALLDSYTADDTQLIIITFGILGNILTIFKSLLNENYENLSTTVLLILLLEILLLYFAAFTSCNWHGMN